jgi:predicted transcriptional regulator
MASSLNIEDIVNVAFLANQYIPFLNQYGPVSNIKMTFETYLKYNSAGYKVKILEEGEIIQINGDGPIVEILGI